MNTFIQDFKSKNSRLPTVTEVSKALKVSQNTAVAMLRDFLTGQKKEVKEKIVKEKNKSKTVRFLKGVFFFVAFLSFVLSVYFTGLWFSGRFNIIISGMISLTMVTFMVASPQVHRFISSPATRGVVWLAFIVAMVFSMASTIAGQYRKTSELAVKSVTVTNELKKYENMEKQEAELISLIDEAKQDKEVHAQTIKSLSSTEEKRLDNWQQIATERKRIDLFNSRITELSDKLEIIRGNMNSSLDDGVQEERDDFYLFLSGLIGIPVNLMEFILSALPAIFIDIVAALSLNLALFLKERE